MLARLAAVCTGPLELLDRRRSGTVLTLKRQNAESVRRHHGPSGNCRGPAAGMSTETFSATFEVPALISGAVQLPALLSASSSAASRRAPTRRAVQGTAATRTRRPSRSRGAGGALRAREPAVAAAFSTEKNSRRRAFRARCGGLEPGSKPSSEPSSAATGLVPDPPCKCTPFAPSVCLTTPPQRRLVVVKQSLGMVEQMQGGSGSRDQGSCGMHLGLVEGIDGSENNNRDNCQTAWSDATIAAMIGSLRGQGASASGAFGGCWSVGSGRRFAGGLGTGRGAFLGALG